MGKFALEPQYKFVSCYIILGFIGVLLSRAMISLGDLFTNIFNFKKLCNEEKIVS